MLQFQSFWVFRFWISNGRGNFRRVLRSWSIRGSKGQDILGVPGVHGILRYWGSQGSRMSQDWVPFLYHAFSLMMNIWNLGSKQSVGVKSKEGICSKSYLKLWFESNWYFSEITESWWFWKRLSRKKVLNNHFLKSLQNHPYPDVLQNSCS